MTEPARADCLNTFHTPNPSTFAFVRPAERSETARPASTAFPSLQGARAVFHQNRIHAPIGQHFPENFAIDGVVVRNQNLQPRQHFSGDSFLVRSGRGSLPKYSVK